MAQISEKHIKLYTYFNKYFSEMKDPRRTQKGNFTYPLDEILFLVISAVISGMENWIAISNFGEIKLDWLKQFFPYKNGIPSHDVLGKLFSRIDTKTFNECFIKWINSISEIKEGQLIAIDGKSIRGSGESGNLKSMFHIVSAYATENKICLCQTTVDKKHNEIIAIPEVLKMLELKGCVVSIDAMGCQKDIAAQIIEKGADYILMVKDNQKGLKEQIEKLFKINDIKSTNQTIDAGHGRIETRKCDVIDNLQFLDVKNDWKSLNSIVRISSNRYIKKTKQESNEIRYYITSLSADAEKLNKNIRSHWSIENNLHWALDVQFNEDRALKKKDLSAVNFNIINKMALALLQNETSYKASKNSKRQRAALDDRYREKLLNV